eukprot:TRINITY_DN10470_c0_g1_i7.p1 TRINITY_DN10470_c0_g1~~TRINITY_DN10470_c0_g1_i7.p1  ORF type:complete len:172 (-),score=26.89 TRINITY_DN10470_c0_g1_i7:124-639(-)
MTVVSKTPGRTQAIGILTIGGKYCLVDMPGYGYAKVNDKDKIRLQNLIISYLKGPTLIKLVCLLVDSRRGIQEGEKEVMKTLDELVRPYMVLLTKSDKLSATALNSMKGVCEEIISSHPMCYPEILPTSSSVGLGLDRLQTFLFQAFENHIIRASSLHGDKSLYSNEEGRE